VRTITLCATLSDAFTQKDVQNGSGPHSGETRVDRRLTGDDIAMVTERRRTSRPRLPVDDNDESDGAQVNEGPSLDRERARWA
jgi:hypothetical protein